MKTSLSILLMLICIISSGAQNTGTLNVVGESKKKVLPDKAVLNLTITAQKPSESESFKKLNEVSLLVLKRLKAEGFSDDQVKLTNFSMNYVNWEQKKKPYYLATQSFTVKFQLDKERLFKTYNRLLTDSVQGVQVNFGTECSDELIKKVQEELIAESVYDARHKANIIATASSSTLMGIANISYKFIDNVQPMPMYRSEKIMTMAAANDIASSPASFLSINEQEFNEEIRVSFTIQTKY